MRLLRGVILPTVIAAPLWMQALQIQFNGWSDIGRLDWRLADWLIGFSFTLIGLFLIGLPAASRVTRLNANRPVKAILLLVIGAVGGGLVAIIYILGLAALGGSVADAFPDVLLGAEFGFVPGIIVALIWVLFNFEWLRPASTRA